MNYFTVNLIIGIVCALLGAGVLIWLTPLTHFWLVQLVGLWLLIMGLRFLLGYIRRAWRLARIRGAGIRFRGKICGYYNDESKRHRGKPLVRLLVRYYDEQDVMEEILLDTDSHEQAYYPRGATVSFFAYDGKYAIAFPPVSTEHLPGEERLMAMDDTPPRA